MNLLTMLCAPVPCAPQNIQLYGMLHRASELKEICSEELGVDGNNLADLTLITTVLLCPDM